jgi:hypothetical protein
LKRATALVAALKRATALVAALKRVTPERPGSLRRNLTG